MLNLYHRIECFWWLVGCYGVFHIFEFHDCNNEVCFYTRRLQKDRLFQFGNKFNQTMSRWSGILWLLGNSPRMSNWIIVEFPSHPSFHLISVTLLSMSEYISKMFVLLRPTQLARRCYPSRNGEANCDQLSVGKRAEYGGFGKVLCLLSRTTHDVIIDHTLDDSTMALCELFTTT